MFMLEEHHGRCGKTSRCKLASDGPCKDPFNVIRFREKYGLESADHLLEEALPLGELRGLAQR